MAESYDCLVIGAGPGGYVAAIRAAQLGCRTAVIERDKVGGRCLNYACIPAKSFLRTADLLDEIHEGSEQGLRVGAVEVDYPAVKARRDKVVATLTGGVRSLFRKNRIDLLAGGGSLTGSASVLVDGTELAARTVILATGSIKRSIPGVEFGDRVIGTEEAWALGELPARLAVVGAGPSGAEIASAFARLGSTVVLLEALERVLPGEDADISRVVERGLKQQGVTVHTKALVSNVREDDQGVSFTLGPEPSDEDADGGTGGWLRADLMVIAAGRSPDVAALGLDQAGVELDEAGLIRVDGTMRTSAPGVYAIGDLVAGPAFAHKASEEGVIAVEDALGRSTHPISYVDIPRATFCRPSVGSFGLTEDQARDQGYEVVVGKVPYGAVGGGIIYGDRGSLVKLVGESRYGELLGGHIVGTRATELIQELVNVRSLEGGYAEVARTIHSHPTLSEAVMEAARAADGWLIHG
jgi:dihydrolipoamide dehydrogenase